MISSNSPTSNAISSSHLNSFEAHIKALPLVLTAMSSRNALSSKEMLGGKRRRLKGFSLTRDRHSSKDALFGSAEGNRRFAAAAATCSRASMRLCTAGAVAEERCLASLGRVARIMEEGLRVRLKDLVSQSD